MLRPTVLFYLTILALFIVSVVGLNYNTPFSDEAIYIVIGRMGLFAHDWWTYGAGFWMAGLPYIYPSLTALAFQTGGIVGSRLLNVIFACLAAEEVYRLTRQLHVFDQATNQLAGVIAIALVGFSTVGLYTARLATYDMPSFLLLLLSINSFLKAGFINSGKYYFISGLALLLAFCTKIVAAVFYPPLLLLSWFIIRSRPPLHRSFYYKYFLFPLGLGLALYAVFFSPTLLAFTRNHARADTGGGYGNILEVIWTNTGIITILAAITIPVLLIAKKSKVVLSLLLLALVIPVFHLVLNRVPTLDKHLYLTAVFLAVIISLSVSWLVRRHLSHPAVRLALPLLTLVYYFASLPALYNLEHSWPNSTPLEQYMQAKVTLDDHVLTQNGAAVILALYDKLYPPTHLTTFDWIDYSGSQGWPGYSQAIRDQYFDYIELDHQYNTNSELSGQIHFALTAKYSLIYSQDRFDVYAKID